MTAPLRELERVVALLEKATPGPWIGAGDEMEGTVHSEAQCEFGGDIVCITPGAEGFEDSARYWPHNAAAISAAVNFIREHGPALLARTEAGADGVDTFAEWLATEMPAGTVIGNPAWWANRIARQYRVRSGVTHPQDASVDAELSELRRVLNKLADYWIAITRDKDVAHRDRAIIDAYDKGLTKCATELRAAMQAKEAK